MNKYKIVAGPLAAALICFFCDLEPGNPIVTRMAAVTVWMAIWWLTEAVHLAVTAFVPIIFLPILGIAEPKIVAFQYMDQIIFLFIGGFLISFAIEKWELHKRIALRILMLTGTRNDRILLGVMITSFIISMWISNTATVMMLITAVMAVIFITDEAAGNHSNNKGLAKGLLIGLAYSATLGGMCTLVGTPPNMVFIRSYTEAYPDNLDVTFASWFVFAFPIGLILLVFCFFLLRFMFLKKQPATIIDKNYFKDSYKQLGVMTYEQKIVSVVFISTALLWFTRADLVLGSFTMPGWNRFFPSPSYIQDSTVAVFMAVLLFVIPAKNEQGRGLLSWKEATKLPFDIILLFGSGFALAKGFEISGLSTWMAGKLEFFHDANPATIIISLVIIVCIISEFASNVASIQLVMPILVVFQKEMDLHPLLLMIPATLAASTGFMLPVATAPNTIVFGSKRLLITDMAKAGFMMDLAGIIIISLLSILLLT